MFQAWQTVKVIAEGSGFYGHAGCVIRTEKQGDNAKVFIRLDSDGSTEGFDPSELEVLG